MPAKKKAPKEALPVQVEVTAQRKAGRPSTFTDAVANHVCESLEKGESLEAICRSDKMPDSGTIRKWVRDNPIFAANYARAREAQAEYYAAEIIQIADTTEDPQKARLQIDARKWYASKIHPKGFGDKLEIDQTTRVAPMTGDQLATEMSQSPSFRKEIEALIEKSGGEKK